MRLDSDSGEDADEYAGDPDGEAAEPTTAELEVTPELLWTLDRLEELAPTAAHFNPLLATVTLEPQENYAAAYLDLVHEHAHVLLFGGVYQRLFTTVLSLMHDLALDIRDIHEEWLGANEMSVDDPLTRKLDRSLVERLEARRAANAAKQAKEAGRDELVYPTLSIAARTWLLDHLFRYCDLLIGGMRHVHEGFATYLQLFAPHVPPSLGPLKSHLASLHGAEPTDLGQTSLEPVRNRIIKSLDRDEKEPYRAVTGFMTIGRALQERNWESHHVLMALQFGAQLLANPPFTLLPKPDYTLEQVRGILDESSPDVLLRRAVDEPSTFLALEPLFRRPVPEASRQLLLSSISHFFTLLYGRTISADALDYENYFDWEDNVLARFPAGGSSRVPRNPLLWEVTRRRLYNRRRDKEGLTSGLANYISTLNPGGSPATWVMPNRAHLFRTTGGHGKHWNADVARDRLVHELSLYHLAMLVRYRFEDYARTQVFRPDSGMTRIRRGVDESEG